MYQILKQAHDAANNQSDWSMDDVNPEELRAAATEYVDASIEFANCPKNANCSISIGDLPPTLQTQLYEMSGASIIYDGGTPPKPQIDGTTGKIHYDHKEFVDWTNSLYNAREGGNPAHENGFVDQQLLFEMTLRKALKPRTGYTMATIAGIIAVIAAVFTAPIWAQVAAGFLNTVAISSALGMTITIGGRCDYDNPSDDAGARSRRDFRTI